MKTKQIITVALAALCVIAAGTAYILLGKADKEEETVAFETTTSFEGAIETEGLTEADMIYVHICGQVNSPGVVCLLAGARVYEAIDAAGGLTAEAFCGAVNQAEVLYDGQMVYIPAVGEEYTMPQETGDGLVNINTATVEELMTLPGIGESRAEDIVTYRESVGDFQVIEDIMQVSGIKDSAFSKIKDYIKV